MLRPYARTNVAGTLETFAVAVWRRGPKKWAAGGGSGRSGVGDGG